MKKTSSILDSIVKYKAAALVYKKRGFSRAQLEGQLKHFIANDKPDFYASLKAALPYIKIIGEIKQASPSEGKLRSPFNVAEINSTYQNSENIVAISVITENAYFCGSEADLAYCAAHNFKNKPLLRKDFLFDEYQILETKLLGAHAFLLIACLFEAAELNNLIMYGQSIGLEPLVEVHSKTELEMVKLTTARCIGVNCRDLRTFKLNTDLHVLLLNLDDSYARIAESGIKSMLYLHKLSTFSDAALIGSHFMKAPNISSGIDVLVRSGKLNTIPKGEK